MISIPPAAKAVYILQRQSIWITIDGWIDAHNGLVERTTRQQGPSLPVLIELIAGRDGPR